MPGIAILAVAIFSMGILFFATSNGPTPLPKAPPDGSEMYSSKFWKKAGKLSFVMSSLPSAPHLFNVSISSNIETMEGAALHYVCLSERIPFLQLRCVSNYVGERDKSKWALREAIMNLNIELQRLIIKHFAQ